MSGDFALGSPPTTMAKRAGCPAGRKSNARAGGQSARRRPQQKRGLQHRRGGRAPYRAGGPKAVVGPQGDGAPNPEILVADQLMGSTDCLPVSSAQPRDASSCVPGLLRAGAPSDPLLLRLAVSGTSFTSGLQMAQPVVASFSAEGVGPLKAVCPAKYRSVRGCGISGGLECAQLRMSPRSSA